MVSVSLSFDSFYCLLFFLSVSTPLPPVSCTLAMAMMACTHHGGMQSEGALLGLLVATDAGSCTIIPKELIFSHVTMFFVFVFFDSISPPLFFISS